MFSSYAKGVTQPQRKGIFTDDEIDAAVMPESIIQAVLVVSKTFNLNHLIMEVIINALSVLFLFTLCVHEA